MNEFTIAMVFVALLGAPAQDSTLEEKAVIRVQQTPASKYDPALPSRSFGNWLNQVVGPQSGVSWRLGECVDQNGTSYGWEQGIPACVEATAILPDDRKIVAQIHVGSFKQGLAPTTKFHFAVIENDSQFLSVRKLGDLPQLLKDPLSYTKSDDEKRSKVAPLPQIKLIDAPQLYYARTPAIFAAPTIAPVEIGETPPPPKPAAPVRISKGVVTGEALTRVQPIYPPIARSVNASGEVLVAIAIDENGKVTEAKATKGHPLLRGAAEDAARKWIFRPTLLDGKPVKQTGALTFVFTPPR